MLLGSPVMSGWFDHNRGACRQLTDTESIVTVDSAPLLSAREDEIGQRHR